ncbi:hypothetical protein AB6809_35835 [Paraburkholderia sp. RCC_158]|jgi:hypothetical protein|uniref:hypothetical protein n=1 Tax=Paraburkholderia sp. RCC_158 TaxID=3239220 RepID=UPI003523A5E7
MTRAIPGIALAFAFAAAPVRELANTAADTAASNPSATGRVPDKADPKTLKERLGDKGSDEQRVNNCKVPVEERGAKPRPDTCR